jgi:muconolactone delta-isomerase
MNPYFKSLTMQFLVVARPKADLAASELSHTFASLLAAEKEKARAFYLDGVIRQIWDCADTLGVALTFEASSDEHLQEILNAFPLVAAGCLDLWVIPLKPYGGFGPLSNTAQ